MKRFGMFAVLFAGVTLSGCGEYSFAAYAPAPPPPVRVEAFGVAPGAGYIWANGYYGYREGRYVWVPGVAASASWPHDLGAWTLGAKRRTVLLYSRALALKGPQAKSGGRPLSIGYDEQE